MTHAAEGASVLPEYMRTWTWYRLQCLAVWVLLLCIVIPAFLQLWELC
jgi:hypothetical protein